MSTHVRERVSRFDFRQVNVSARPLGLTPGELVAALLTLIFFVSAAVYYFASLKPERERLATLEAAMASQQQVLRTSLADLKPSDAAPVTDAPTDAMNSLLSFKSQYLKPVNKGRIDLLNEINALAKKNNTQLASGIDMSFQPVVVEDESKSSKRGGKNKADLNVFPQMSVHFEVAGQYSNLRAFIAELERSKQFIVLDSVTLTSIEATDGEGGRSSAAGSGINLSINLTAYFQP
ncbi:MAG TPA: GspMb/PilO family protein [Blastocatellia bacterium]|nr:GspMb/PilO family protein [Blastocatellia bacterium]